MKKHELIQYYTNLILALTLEVIRQLYQNFFDVSLERIAAVEASLNQMLL